ncbi:hypothetical protein E2562_033608 [Oryza meyeriana var. granulata]|uniref:Uncharacterized protein n=1 Tax=Oryza meyeriana var. granulata TaxID=110450 RepID=A0A6G1FF95_9ORYZ|nr:hypothetical protein E2562_033608 [Oryza meyeriana var. granulata]
MPPPRHHVYAITGHHGDFPGLIPSLLHAKHIASSIEQPPSLNRRSEAYADAGLRHEPMGAQLLPVPASLPPTYSACHRISH